jgi:hypothetical protein
MGSLKNEIKEHLHKVSKEIVLQNIKGNSLQATVNTNIYVCFDE